MNSLNNLLVKNAELGNTNLVKVLLNAGADVDVDDGWALRWASYKGHVEIVKVLLEAGADIGACDGGKSAIYWANNEGHVEVVNILERAIKENVNVK
jgi:ankyrin repeat protein